MRVGKRHVRRLRQQWIHRADRRNGADRCGRGYGIGWGGGRYGSNWTGWGDWSHGSGYDGSDGADRADWISRRNGADRGRNDRCYRSHGRDGTHRADRISGRYGTDRCGCNGSDGGNGPDWTLRQRCEQSSRSGLQGRSGHNDSNFCGRCQQLESL